MNNTTDILVLDDDPDLCLLMETILKFAGYKVQRCSSPDALYRLLAASLPQLIVMDMLLSGKDGRDVCGEIKMSKETSKIKVMMISAHPDAEKTCREAGADDFLSKPFDIDIFTAKVAAFIKIQGV
jgi:DNA-binding response OmpR family regulator